MKFRLSQVKPELPDRRHDWPALSRKDMLGRPNFFAGVPRFIREFKVPQRRRRRKRHLKSDFTFLKLQRDYHNSLTLSKVGKLSWIWILQKNIQGSREPREIRRRVFTLSIKREIRQFTS